MIDIEKIRELMNFILTECGDMSYTAYIKIHKRQDMCGCILSIDRGYVNFERLYYLTDILKQKFDIEIIALDLSGCDLTYSDFDEWFTKIDIDCISIQDNNIHRLPKFNKDISILYVDEDIEEMKDEEESIFIGKTEIDAFECADVNFFVEHLDYMEYPGIQEIIILPFGA